MGILGGRKTAEAESAPPAPAGLSVIAVGMTVRGDLDSNGTVKIEGTVEGDVSTRAQALVAKGGAVHGDLSADEIVVGGTVTGAVRARGRVEIQTGAVVEGDITTRRILVAEGATLNGMVRMGDAAFDDPQSHAGHVGHASEPAVPPTVARPSVPVARVAVPPRPPMP